MSIFCLCSSDSIFSKDEFILINPIHFSPFIFTMCRGLNCISFSPQTDMSIPNLWMWSYLEEVSLQILARILTWNPGFRLGPKPSDRCPWKKREDLETDHREWRERGARVVEGLQDWTATTNSGRAAGSRLSFPAWRAMSPVHTLILDSGHQNCERIKFHCFKPSLWGFVIAATRN
jgi:hypothetical protein